LVFGKLSGLEYEIRSLPGDVSVVFFRRNRMHASGSSTRACLLVILTVVVPVGCGPSGSAPGSREELTISQVAQIFRMRQRAQKAPPRDIKDIQSQQTVSPAAFAAIKSGEVVVNWGVGLADDTEAAATVLAYQKDVPEKGGEVLMQDGTAKKMTADEFKAAKKPPGSK
jgi:hypothetical protein